MTRFLYFATQKVFRSGQGGAAPLANYWPDFALRRRHHPSLQPRLLSKASGRLHELSKATVSGTVDEIKNLTSPARGSGGLHLVLSASSGAIEVHVGPASFVSSKGFTFAKGDALTVVGSKVAMMGQEVLIAREIKKGDQVLTLRDAKGFPLWVGRGRTPSTTTP